MKRKLLTLFFLLTGFFYLLSISELDSNECKQNVSKENHTYITCDKSADSFNFQTVKTFDLPKTFNNNYFEYCYEKVTVKIPHFPNHSPPDKIFLRYLSLRI